MSWIVQENKLDDQQRSFLDNHNLDRDNEWIKGFPGSGKSVLLAYTYKKIKNEHPGSSVAVVVFTHSLIKMFQAAFAEMGIAANIMTYYSFMDQNRSYDYILCDEVQDLTERVLQNMKTRGRHIIVAGDENQSIYESDPRYHEPTVSSLQVRDLLSASVFELGIIHRLSSSIINAVQSYLPGMNIFTAKRDLTKGSTQIRLCKGSSFSEEIEYIYKEGKKAVNVGQTAAILVPTHDKVLDVVQGILTSEGKPAWKVTTTRYGKVDYDALNEHFNRNNIPVQYVGNSFGSFSENSRKITIMTYHSAKGLDFDNVFMPGLDSYMFISKKESLSKILFMVAMTRSRSNLYLTYSSYSPVSYVTLFSSQCSNINIHDYLSNRTLGGGSNSVFGF